MMVDALRVNLFTAIEESTIYSTASIQSFQQPSCLFMFFVVRAKAGVCAYSLDLPMIGSRTLLRLAAIERPPHPTRRHLPQCAFILTLSHHPPILTAIRMRDVFTSRWFHAV